MVILQLFLFAAVWTMILTGGFALFELETFRLSALTAYGCSVLLLPLFQRMYQVACLAYIIRSKFVCLLYISKICSLPSYPLCSISSFFLYKSPMAKTSWKVRKGHLLVA
jgi:hypothetical protein